MIMESTKSNVRSLEEWKVEKGMPVVGPDVTIKKKGTGGNPPMKNDYVTHEELDHAIDRLSAKMDLMEAHIDTKFEKVNMVPCQ